ncbi:MAG: hypothetical protein V1755_00465 [Chloroflexota bacterium]
MNSGSWKRTVPALVCLSTMLSCTLPLTAGGRETAATMVVETVSALQRALAASQTAEAVPIPPSTVSEPPSATATLFATPVPEKPVVQTTTLCWTGPGIAYPVVSGIRAGEVVNVLGVGSRTGWLVIENPVYGDRCWIETKNLKLDPFFSTAGLEVFNPPPTPGPKITPGPSPTP